MSRVIDNAPVKNTCPIINDVIRYVEGFEEEFGNEGNKHEFEMTFMVMEEIRSANSELREWGNEQYNEAVSIGKERDELIDELDEANQEIRNLKEYIDGLENKED